MKIKNASFCRKCLQQSLPVEMMIRIAQLVSPEYDIYRRSGLTEGMPISNQDAAQRIVADLIEDGFFIDFVEALIRINKEGYMGRAYPLKGLNDVITGLIQEGYSYDEAAGQFFENQWERISQNWGRLRDGDERRMTILRLDIVGSSSLVKQNSGDAIDKAYNDLRTIVTKSVLSRLGRLWSWEGDGALGAFTFGPKEQAAVFCGMNILHELFLYNRLKNPLNKPIRIRIGVHIGMIRYYDNVIERLKNETIKQALSLESGAPPDSMGISQNLFISLEPSILNLFTPGKPYRGGRYRLYNISLGQV
jgi:class 3 adenylate cyclase